MAKKATWGFTKSLYELPYEIMQLEKDIEEGCKEIREMREKLAKLKAKENGRNTKPNA